MLIIYVLCAYIKRCLRGCVGNSSVMRTRARGSIRDAARLASALDTSSEPLSSSEATTPGQREAAWVLSDPTVGGADTRSLRGEAGEGIGLSIVKRLCEMLDATIEMRSVPDVGTTFRILFPRHYAS